MRVARRELYAGRALLLAPDGDHDPAVHQHLHDRAPSVRQRAGGLAWPADPQWGNFVEAFKVANMGALLASSVFIVLAVVPDLARHLDDGRLRDRPPPHPGRASCCSSCSCSA